MNRIQRSNRLAWERLTRALDHLGTDAQERPVRRHAGEVCATIRGIRFGQLAERCRPVQYTIAFDQRQIRSNHGLRGRQRLANTCAGLLVEEPRQNGT